MSSIGDDFIWLALFDVWTSNTDRHANHYNLLYSADTTPRFLPIDHGLTLDSIDRGEDPERQTENDNLTDSPIFSHFVARKDIISFCQNAGENQELFQAKVASCLVHLEAIIAHMPSAWQQSKPNLTHDIHRTIFSQHWLATTWDTYLGFLISAARR